jgi:hypothetical protein
MDRNLLKSALRESQRLLVPGLVITSLIGLLLLALHHWLGLWRWLCWTLFALAAFRPVFDIINIAFIPRRLRRTRAGTLERESKTSADRRSPVKIQDDVLGELTFDSEEDMWTARLEFDESNIEIAISGDVDDAPPPETLLQRARQIAREPRTLADGIRALLGNAATNRRWAKYADEIKTLKPERVELPWIDRPLDGLIFFDGPSPLRIWRCDIIGGSPRDLSFDS